MNLVRSNFSRLPLNMVRNITRLNSSNNFGMTNRDRKRFYKKVSIAESPECGTNYEILLDQRKLKTPLGSLVTIENQFLALALAEEWDRQSKKIDLSSMHLNSLINTMIDNPLKQGKDEIRAKIMYFLDWDTLLYRSDLPVEFRQLQVDSWDPVLKFVNEQFQTKFRSTFDLHEKDLIRSEDRLIIEKYLKSFDQPSLTVFLYIVEQLKSILLTIALLKQFLPVEKIASLSRLETEFQISRWSNVEHYHDYNLMDATSKIAAAYLVFYCLNNNVTQKILKNS